MTLLPAGTQSAETPPLGAPQRRRGGGLGGIQPLAPAQPPAQPPAQQGFTATNNLIGTQVNPVNSGVTNGAQRAATTSQNAYNNFDIGKFQGVQPLDLSGQQGQLQGANAQMQGNSFNFNPANAQYGQAQAQQAAAQQGAGSYMAQAAAMAGGATGGGAGYAQAADTAKARAATMAGLEGLNGPDRNALGAESLALMEERSKPGYDQTLRAVNAKNAAMGRRGSGVTTNELGDVTLARERELALARRDVANTSAEAQMSDRMAKLQGAQGVAQGFGAMDQTAAQINDTAARASSANGLQAASLMRGLGQDQYGMGRDASGLSMDVGDRYGTQARDNTNLTSDKANFTRGIANDSAGLTRDTYGAGVKERDTERQDRYDQGNFLGSRASDNANYLGQREGQDRANRNETRGEREYQYGLSQDSINNDFRTSQQEENLRNGSYNRGLGIAGLGFGVQSPQGAYESQADRQGANAQGYYGLAGSSAQLAGNNYRRGLPAAQ